MTTALDRRLAPVEAALDAIAPPDDPLTKFKAANPWFEWTTCDELSELEQIYRIAEDVGEMPEADEARVMAIMFASQARMLSGRAEGHRSAAAAVRHPGRLREGEAGDGVEKAVTRRSTHRHDREMVFSPRG